MLINLLGDCVGEDQSDCDTYRGVLAIIDKVANALGVQLGGANNDPNHLVDLAEIIIQKGESVTDSNVLAHYDPVHDTISIKHDALDPEVCPPESCAGVVEHEAGHMFFEQELGHKRTGDADLDLEFRAIHEGVAFIVADHLGGGTSSSQYPHYRMALDVRDVHSAGHFIAEAWRRFSKETGVGETGAFYLFMDAVDTWKTVSETGVSANGLIESVKHAIVQMVVKMFGDGVPKEYKMHLIAYLNMQLNKAFKHATILPGDNPPQPPSDPLDGLVPFPPPDSFTLPHINGGWCRVDTDDGPDDPTVVILIPCRGLGF